MKPALRQQLDRYASRLAELNAVEGDERARLAQTVTRLFLRGSGRNLGNDKR